MVSQTFVLDLVRTRVTDTEGGHPMDAADQLL
jgi:hypothetical protein